MWGRAYLDVPASKFWHYRCKSPGIINRAWRYFFGSENSRSDGHPVIVFSESRRLVYNARAILRRDIVVYEYSERSIFILMIE